MVTLVSDIGEIELIRQVLLRGVTGEIKGDDCAIVPFTEVELLWSIDPCPVPVANLLGLENPETWGHYTAAINLSDIAACGGTPLGMLVSLELSGQIEVNFVRGFQRGLLKTLSNSNSTLMGGNVKSSSNFRATGTVIGAVRKNRVTRKLKNDRCFAYVIGGSGNFWAGVLGLKEGWNGLGSAEKQLLTDAVMRPQPQTSAGFILGDLPFEVACMDCSDGVASAVQELAQANALDIVLKEKPKWKILPGAIRMLKMFDISIDNACYHFGDWQLLCLVPQESAARFENAFRNFPITKIGEAVRGKGNVETDNGRKFDEVAMNKNFKGGYNSFSDIDDLLEKFLRRSIFLK